jgi:enamine deaminase RidA (YjgF/YER057c/UK114 family)
MPPNVETSTPPNTPKPIGPYSHIAKVGPFITIGGTAGVNLPQVNLPVLMLLHRQSRSLIRSR